MATASSDETVKLWNSQDGKLLRELKEHQAEVCAVAFSPNGKLLVSGGKDRTIRCWKVDEVLGQEQKQ
jgi:WD40 repeat protein